MTAATRPAPQETPALGPQGRRLARPRNRARDRVGNPWLPCIPKRRQGRQRAPRPAGAGLHWRRRKARSLEPDQCAPARRRRRSKSRAGSGNGRSDSIMLIHTDPDERRLALLSIPAISASRSRAAARTRSTRPIRTVALPWRSRRFNLTGLPVNHVMIVDFKSFWRSRRRDRRCHDQREETDPLAGLSARTRRSAAPAGRVIASARGSRR